MLAAYFLFHDWDLEAPQWPLTTLRPPTPTRICDDSVPRIPDIPSTYVVAFGDLSLWPDCYRREARRRLDADVMEIDGGHCPRVSRPLETAAILHQLAAETYI
jgi:hypothetical protein